MSAHNEGTEGSSSMSRPSLVDPNIYVLSEAICSSMENSMGLLSATMQRNALVMANTIREGFAAHPSIEGCRNTLSKKRAHTSSQVARNDSSGGSSHKRSRNMAREALLPKWWWLRQATPKGTEQLMLSASWTPLIPSRIRNNLWLLLPPWIGRWWISRWRRQQGPLFLRLWLFGYATF